MATELLIVFGLMLLNGVFAAAEISVLSVRKTRLAELKDSGSPGVAAVRWLREQPERFLATVQVGLTVVGTTAAAFGGEALAEDFSHQLARVPVVGAYAAPLGLTVVILGISFLEIVVGELVPKSLALRSAEKMALTLGPGLRVMATVVKPLVWVLTLASNAVLRLFGDRTSFSETRLSPEELQELVEEAARVGSLDAQTSEIASRAIDFRALSAVDVMVPRDDVQMLPAEITSAALAELLRTARFARMPVYEGSRDNVVGYVTVRDLLGPSLRGDGFALRAHLRPMKFVPDVTLAANLLRTLQSERLPLAMIVDENGTILGLVTVEDLVEELVGDILTEADGAPQQVTREPAGTWLAPGGMPLHEVNRALDFELPESEQYSTIAGLTVALRGQIPRAGERVPVHGGAVLEVVDATARRVKLLRVHAPPKEPAPEEPAES